MTRTTLALAATRARTLPTVPASTCQTCENGCNCSRAVPTDGCGHFACWGPAAVPACPGRAVQRIRTDAALYPHRYAPTR